MSCFNKGCNCACSCIGILISVVFGAAVALLFAFDLIPNIVVTAWIAFGIAILMLIFVIAAALISGTRQPNALSKCLCSHMSCLLAGIIGTLISAIAALAIVLTNAFVSVIILVAIGAFFFALMIIGMISFLNCVCCKVYSV